MVLHLFCSCSSSKKVLCTLQHLLDIVSVNATALSLECVACVCQSAEENTGNQYIARVMSVPLVVNYICVIFLLGKCYRHAFSLPNTMQSCTIAISSLEFEISFDQAYV